MCFRILAILHYTLFAYILYNLDKVLNCFFCLFLLWRKCKTCTGVRFSYCFKPHSKGQLCFNKNLAAQKSAAYILQLEEPKQTRPEAIRSCSLFSPPGDVIVLKKEKHCNVHLITFP